MKGFQSWSLCMCGGLAQKSTLLFSSYLSRAVSECKAVYLILSRHIGQGMLLSSNRFNHETWYVVIVPACTECVISGPAECKHNLRHNFAFSYSLLVELLRCSYVSEQVLGFGVMKTVMVPAS